MGCVVLPSLTRVTVSISMGIISIITIERYYIICNTFQQQLSQLKIKLLLAAVILLSVMIDLPNILNYRINNDGGCGIHHTSLTGYDVPMVTILLTRDVLFLIMFCGTIYRIRTVLTSHERKINMKKIHETKKLSRVVLVLIVIGVLFIIMVFPRDILHVTYFISWFSPPGIGLGGIKALNTTLKILHMANSVVNVFVYSKLHGKFRKRMKRKCSRIFSSKRREKQAKYSHVSIKTEHELVVMSSPSTIDSAQIRHMIIPYSPIYSRQGPSV